MEKTSKKFKQYLLGSLSAEETEAIDLSLLTDDSLESELDFAAHNLMEDFLEKTLTPQEIQLFHQNFLVNEEREKELKELQLLKKYAQNYAGKKSDQRNTPVFWSNLTNFFILNLRPSVAIAAVLMIGLLIGFYFIYPREDQFASLNKTDLSNLNEFQNLSKLGLTSGNMRDSNGATKLSGENLTEKTLFRLALPIDHNSFDIKILRGEKEILQLAKIRAYQNSNGTELRLLVPSNNLLKGSYKIEATPVNSSDAPVYYVFTVE